MRASRPALLLCGALVVAGCACSPGEDADGGPDGGRDAGRDAGRDTGRDVGRDVGLDSGSDAGLAHGGWTPIADAPVGCTLLAASPELLAATTWAIEPCPDRAGCRRIAPVRDLPPSSVGFRVERGHGAHDGARGVVALFGDTPPWRDEWIVDDLGATLAGFRTPRTTAESRPCHQGSYDVSGTHFAFHLIDGGDTVSNVLYRGEIGHAPTRLADLAAPSGGLAFVQELRLDSQRTASWLSTQSVQAIEADGTVSAVSGTAAGCSAAIADVIGDSVFVDCGGATITTVYVQLPGGVAEPLLDTSVLSFGLDSDGANMAWFVYTRTADGFDAQIWTAPHAIHAADVRARRLADVPSVPMAYPVDLRIGFGHVAVLEAVDVIGVYRLSDGARAELRAPAGERWNGFVQYIGPDEIAATSGVYTGPASDRALMFVRVDSLDFVP